MSATTPSTEAFYELIHSDGCLDEHLMLDIERLDSERRAENSGKYRRPSIYVEAFEKMVNTVYESEPHLLTAKELDVLTAFAKLSYDARYCLVRLLLRKTNAWHTLKSMEKFKKEVGEDGLISAILSLCRPIEDKLEVKTEIKDEPGPNEIPGVEVIDLTLDSDEEEDVKPNITVTELGPSSIKEQDIKPSLDSLLQTGDSPPYEPDFSFFLEDESFMGLEEVLKKLSNDQLRDLLKETKIKTEKTNKDAMIYSLLLYASTQQPLSFDHKCKTGRDMKSRDGLKQTLLPYKGETKPTPETQEKRLLQMALAKLGKSVRVNVDLYWLVARLNVIYERSTEYPKSLLVPSLLISFKKRTYPQYPFTRDSMIWSTREEFMDYFEALRLEAAIQTELEPSPPRRPVTKTPAPTPGQQNKFVTPGRGRSLTIPLRTPSSTARDIESSAPYKKEEDDQDNVLELEEPLKVQAARRVKEVFDKRVFQKWKESIAKKQGQGAKERAPGLERFEPGFVYTRIFSHAMRALATLKLHREENAIVEALLQQTFWRQGKRASWYDRRALLSMNYLCRNPDPEVKKKDLEVLRRAMEGIKEALDDENTHLIYRPCLVRRLVRLEKQLKIPEEDRCFCSGELRKAEEVQFFAERIVKSDKSLELDAYGRPIKGKENGLRTYFSSTFANTTPNGKTSTDIEKSPVAENITTRRWKGKSLWRGRNGEQVNVECRALQYYEDLGYKGFHSETRILTTLFALLFWDIIFTDVPGAFETIHQTAPLDIAHDSFYRARKDLIDTRLEEIKQKGRAGKIVKLHDDLHREKNTWCIGVRWDICTKEDLLDIVECLGGESLAIICRLFCEDYAGRSSGVPDLIVWNTAAGICKFVEVKGPGDSPSENQKLWFDSLIGAGANVEICKVIDKDKPPPPKSMTKKTGTWHSSSLKGKGKALADINVKMDFANLNSDDHLRDEPCGSHSGLGKRRRSQENADALPRYTATPPTSPSSTSALRRPHCVEVIIPPPKKQKLKQSP